MSKATPKKTARKLSLNKKTVQVFSNKSIVANLNDTKRPLIIISMGCGSDFTRQIPADFRKLLMTDFTKPAR